MVEIRNDVRHKQLARPGDLIGVRYRVVRWLGEGAQGQTYEVEDSIRGGRYALKLIRLETTDVEAIASLKQEFRTLAALEHPAIIKVRDFGVASWGTARDEIGEAERGWFYTADLIEGRDLFSATHAATIEQLIAMSLQAAAALACMHARGILHRDLKPDNMLLDNRGCLRLIDFGLSLIAGSSPPIDGAGDEVVARGADADGAGADAAGADAADASPVAAGTPDYLPPEIALGQRADPRSDLYSLGAVLYQVATRELPFPGENAAQVIRRQLHDVPESPERLRADLPPALASIIMRLLEKEPAARYQTADALYAALADVLGEGSIDGVAGQALAAATRPENRLRTGVLFGRQAERAELREQLLQILDCGLDEARGLDEDRERDDDREKRKRTSAPGGRFIVVSGESGVGKSALIDDFLREVALDDLPVIAGSCGMGGARALQGVAEIVQQAARLTSEAKREEHRWVIDRLSANEDGATGGEELSGDSERLRLAHSVTAFLQAVAEDRPLVVCVESLDQADATTIEIVGFLLRNPGRSPLLCLAELRGSGDRAELGELMVAVERHAHARHVALAPLAPPEVREFVAFLLVDGEAPAELLDWLSANTGMPYLIIEILRFLLRRGHLGLVERAFVCPDGVPESMLREGVQTLVGEKYADVSGVAREVLHVVAVTLGPVDVPTVRAALRTVEPALSAGMDGASDAAVVLEDLVHNRLLAVAAEYRENAVDGETEGQRYAFGSSLEQTVVYEAIPAVEQRRIHAALATAMESRGGEHPDVESLAHHYTRAELAEPGYRFAVLAAQKAAGLFCDDGACQWYEAALRCAQQDDERCAVLEQLAITCQRSGQLDQGLDHLRTALRLVGEVATGQRSRLLDRVGQLHVEQGELDAAMGVYAEALETLGQVTDADPAARMAILANMGWVHLYHGDLDAARSRSAEAFRFSADMDLEEADTESRTPLSASRAVLIAARRQVLMCQAAIELSAQQFADAATTYEEALRISRRLGNPHGEATALSNLGVTSSLCGDIDTAMQRWRESLEIRRRVQHFKGIADCQNNIGIGHYEYGRPAASLQAYGDALAIHRRIGGRLGEAMANLNIGEACLDLGWLRSAYQTTLRALQGHLTAGEEDGIQRGIMQLGLVLARLSASDALAALVEQAEARYDAPPAPGAAQQPLQQATPPRLRGLLAMVRGEAAEAVRRLAEAQVPLAESGESRLGVDNQLDLIAAATAAGDRERARTALEAAAAEEAAQRSPLLRARLELANLALQRAAPEEERNAEILDPWPERLDRLIAGAAEEGTRCFLLVTVAERLRGQLHGTSRPAEGTAALQRAKEAGEAVLVADLEFAASIQPAMGDVYLPEMQDLLLTDGEVEAGVASHLRLADLDREQQAARLALAERRQHGVAGREVTDDGVGVVPSNLSDAQWRLMTWLAELEGTTDLSQLWQSIRAELSAWIGARQVLIVCGVGEAPLELVAGADAGLSESMRSGRILTVLREAVEARVGHRVLVRGETCTDLPSLPDLCVGDVASVLVLTFTTDETSAALRGAVYADTVSAIPAQSAVDDHLLGLLGRAIGRAVKAALRLARAERRLEQITQLYQLSAVPARSVNPDQVLALSMTSMIKLTGAERGFIFLSNAGEIECRVATDQEGEPISDPVGEVSWSILMDVMRTNEAVKVDDALTDRQLSSQSSIVDLQLRSVMCVPIRSEQKTLGMAYVDNRTRSGNFSDDDLRVFSMFGDQIATALDKAYHFVQLQEANRLKSEFLTNVSHELLTPLNGIIGFAQLLGDEELTADGKEGLGYLDHSAKHLLSIVEGLLTLSSIEAGSFKPEHVDFDLEALMGEFNLELTCRCGERGLDSDVVIEDDVPRQLWGDAKLIKQLLEHLVDNAIKFTEQGMVRVRVCMTATPSVREASRQHAELRFEVEDTGIGVPEAAKDLIFLPFTQADGSMTRHHGGTGLGLTICQRVVRLLGGEMGLKSELGQGSMFWFTARLGRAGEPSAART